MRSYKLPTIIGGALLGLSALVTSCGRDNLPAEKAPENKNYFGTIPMSYESGMGMTSGDFDGDGDLDLIVGARRGDFGGEAKLYFYENDGKGNFTLRNYEK